LEAVEAEYRFFRGFFSIGAMQPAKFNRRRFTASRGAQNAGCGTGSLNGGMTGAGKPRLPAHLAPGPPFVYAQNFAASKVWAAICPL
jgi:hypothetical protein